MRNGPYIPKCGLGTERRVIGHVENKLQAWSLLLRIRKSLRISVSLNYVESGRTVILQLTANHVLNQNKIGEREIWRHCGQAFDGGK
jgi:hypothetical protein